MKAVSFVGLSGTGKTELICRLVAWFAGQGLKVGVLKHSHKTGLGDEHKDTGKFRRAGALAVGLAGPGLLQITHIWDGEPPLSLALEALAAEADLLLVEGYKTGPLPKVVVLGPEPVPDETRLLHHPSNVALVSPRPAASPLPTFQTHQIAELGRFILEHLDGS